MNIILLGAPGAGKGTQAEIISAHLNIPTISTGDIIRAALKNGTEMGLKAKSFIDKGHLVPDEVVIGIVTERIKQEDCKKGFILDGFPRTIAQAEALDNSNIIIDCVLDIEVDEEVIYKRMSGRRVCEKCARVYNVNTDKRPRVDGKCDVCAGTLVQRMDDKIETVKERLKVYYDQTHALKEYYDKRNMRIVVDGAKPLPEITENVLKILQAQENKNG